MEVQRNPPPIEDLVEALKPVVRSGLPLDPGLDDMRLLGLRGVVARSIDPNDRLGRVKALDGLLRQQLAYYPDDVLSEAARVLFGLTPGSRGTTATLRRARAAKETGYDAEHFRKRIEPKILKQLAWQLNQDSQNYVPRQRETPPPLEVSGDTPYIAVGDVTARDKNEHEEALSRIWAEVYALRAKILRVERLKAWPYDETEPEMSTQVLRTATTERDAAMKRTKDAVDSYIERYGEAIAHGGAQFDARALTRLAELVSND